MEVIGGLAVHTALVLALLVLVELLKAILGIRVILDVVALVLLDVTLVLKSECTAWASGKKKYDNRKITNIRQNALLEMSVQICHREDIKAISHTKKKTT